MNNQPVESTLRPSGGSVGAIGSNAAPILTQDASAATGATSGRYVHPRSDYPNEGCEPNERGYVPPSIENAERFAPADSLMWVCVHCDALNRAADGECRRCGADNTEEVTR